MGWLFRHCTRKELIEERTKEWKKQREDGTVITSTCIAHCYRGNLYSGVLWAVWERTFMKDGMQVQSTERWITCDLLKHQRDCGWGYRDLDELMHPYYYSCPLGYLALVPIEIYGGNEEWRDAVRKHHAQRKAKRRIPVRKE